MNKFLKFIAIFILLIGQITAQEAPSLKNLCVRAGAKLSKDALQEAIKENMLPDDCLKLVLIEKIKLKLFPLVIDVPKATLSGHNDRVMSVVISADGKIGFSASSDGSIRPWDLVNYRSPFLLPHEGVDLLAMTPNGNKLLAGSTLNETVKLWDFKNNKISLNLNIEMKWLTSLAMTSDGAKGLFGLIDGTIKVLDLFTNKENAPLVPSDKEGDVMAVSAAITRAGTKVLSSFGLGYLKVWNLDNRQEIYTLPAYGFVNSLSMTPDGEIGLSSSNVGVRVWDLIHRKSANLIGHNYVVMSVGITADGTIGISGSRDKTVKVWNLVNRKELATLIGHTDGVDAVAITPDGFTALSGSEDKTVKVWDLRPLLIDRFPEQFATEWLKEIYQLLYQDDVDKQIAYHWIVKKFEALDQAEAEETERAEKRRKHEASEQTEQPEKRSRRGELEENQ